MKITEALMVCIAIALVAGSGGQSLGQNVDKPKDAKAGVAEQRTTEKANPAIVDIWMAAAKGNLDAVKQQLTKGTDVNGKAPSIGLTPLMAATIAGQSEVAELLLSKGAKPNIGNNEGSTALHMAAFFGHIEIVRTLVAKGADANIRDSRSETPLDTVKDAWSEELEGVYKAIGGYLKLELDFEKIKSARPQIAALLAEKGGKSGKAKVKSTGYRGSYYVNGEIHVNTYGTPEGKPLTTGHSDFKPSWSKTGDRLVFFRRLKNDPDTAKWKTAICIINVDSTGFHQLTDGTHTDFNQTWTRDGSNTPIWNRKNPETGGFHVMASKVGNSPGQEVALTDKSYHTWAYTCLMDGRVLVQSVHPKQGYGYFLMTPNVGGEPRFQRIDCELATKGLLNRISVSPSEKSVCFEYQTGFESKETGRTLYIADFDAEKRTITNVKPFANEEADPNRWFAYPRWTKDEAAIVYHASPSLYLYTLKDGSTVKVSTNDRADYRYPHAEATPK